MKSKHIFLILVLILSYTLPAKAQEIKGKVVAISDGDTLTLLDDNKKQLKIRLAEIDTPESKQPYGKRAKQELSKLVFAKTATVAVQAKDRYGRIVGRVYIGDLDVNAEMVRQGAAWVYSQYAKDQALYVLEAKARQDKTGLWGLPEVARVPPWEWRRQRRKRTAGGHSNINPKSTIQRQGDFQCDGKTTCGQIKSCAEARFYLVSIQKWLICPITLLRKKFNPQNINYMPAVKFFARRDLEQIILFLDGHYLEQCGLSRLDGDSDGVPCESLCR